MGTVWPVSELETFEFVGHERRVELLTAIQRQRAELDAREQVLLHAMHADPILNIDGSPAADKQWVREDVACAKRISPQTAAGRLHQATALVTRLPATLALLGQGKISIQHACRLADAVAGLPDAVTAQVQARVLPRAAQQTVPQFSASVQRAVLALDPRARDEQVEEAVAQRRVVFSPHDDGTTEMWTLFGADTAAAIRDQLDRAADRLRHTDRDHGPARTADQRRADALAHLILGNGNGNGNGNGGVGGSARVTPHVNVTVALSTLLTLDEQAGELDGHGPIPAALARALAFDPTGTWRRLLTDDQGRLVQVAAHTYRPPAAMARQVRAQNVTCVFPGCRRRARRCELDHVIAWNQCHLTHPDNLQPLCARHHHLKHEAPWHVRRQPDGTTEWTSPSGHTYARPPDQLPRDTTNEPRPVLKPEAEPAKFDDPPPF